MARPIIIPTQTPREQMRPKGSGRWPNRTEQAQAAAKAGRK